MWMTHEMMLPYVDQLMDDYHIIAPDLTGHGSYYAMKVIV